MTGDSAIAERRDSTAGRSDAETADSERGEADGRDEADAQTENDAEAGDADQAEAVTRRAFVRATGATAAAGTAAVMGTDEATAQAQTYEFGGEVAAWRGRTPSEIEGEDNPTIELQAGEEYEFWFENIDGAPHNITMQDADGNTIVQSDLVQEEGATASVTFTATPEMAQYICTIHPTTMVGDVEVTGELEGAGGGGISLPTALFATALVLAFVSPLLFAFFLFSRGGGRGGGETTTRT